MPRGFAFPPLPGVNGFAMVEGAAAAERSLRDLLLTEPGERVGRPDYGTGLGRFLYAPNTPTTRTAIQAAVSSAIQQFLPELNVLEIQVIRDPDAEESILLSVHYRLVGAALSHVTTLSLPRS